MDRVRFGRALGYGARHAAKTLMSAAEAAAAPNPSSASKPSPQGGTRPAPPPPPRAAAPSQAARVATAAKYGNAAAQQAGRSFLAPVKKFSNTVLQQVLGTMFALFALVMGGAVWKHRAEFAGPHNTTDAHRLYFAVAVFALFAYFAISSFVRASRAGRR